MTLEEIIKEIWKSKWSVLMSGRSDGLVEFTASNGAADFTLAVTADPYEAFSLLLTNIKERSNG